MKPRYLIACEIIRHEIEYLQKDLPMPVEVNFLRKGFHQNPDTLRQELQAAIDAAGDDYEHILLGYGLCGKGLEGITARATPLVVPRVHDCISLLLGSAKRYDELFATHPGTYYYSPGWVEWGHDAVERTPAQGFGLDRTFEEYVELFGEDNARYLMELEQSWKKNYTRAAYITSGLPAADHWEKKAREIAASSGWQFEHVEGSLSLLRALIRGPWPETEFLTVPPHHQILASYDGRIVVEGK
jgi:hypothetical protein